MKEYGEQFIKFGERVKERRKLLHLSQEELAFAVGYTTRTAIFHIEKGERDLPRDKIMALATALKCSPAYLMGLTDDPNFKQENTSIMQLTDLISQLSEEEVIEMTNFVKYLISKRESK